jgi:hypothetical protein
VNRLLKYLCGTIAVVTIYVALFSIHWTIGLSMLVGHVGYEVFDYLEYRALVQQMQKERMQLLNLDNYEPKTNEGNC